jgi:spore germination cell wall hydrolase CwlJ-like protein
MLALIPTVTMAQVLANATPTRSFDPSTFVWVPPIAEEHMQVQDKNDRDLLPDSFEMPADMDKDEISLDNLIEKLKQSRYQFTERDVQCMARNIFHEAANEPYEGMVLVGIVTLNRLVNPNYPKTVCDVIYQRGSYVYTRKKKQHKVTVCQFTWTCENHKHPQETNPRWLKSLEIARNLSDGKYSEWREKWIRSHHYHAYYVNPRWRLARLGRVGAHIFYE